MRYILLTVLLTVLISQTAFARCRRTARQNPVMAALQNIISGNNQPTQTRSRRLSAEKVMPFNSLPLPYTRNMQQKYPCQLEQPRLIPEMRVPDILKMQEIRRPEMRMSSPIITEMPKQYIPNMPVGSLIPARLLSELTDVPMAIQNIPEVLSMPRMQERFGCPCASPKALVNPLLPAASPVSAYAPPTSNLLPPATPYTNRSHFLRKIPIPPPTL